ncbi:unnamed protein product, partial [Rotaria sp. Silwood1]
PKENKPLVIRLEDIKRFIPHLM